MRNPNFYKQIKEYLDSIYEKTCDGEYIGTWKQFNNRLLEECVTELIRRGIVTKSPYQRIGSRGRHYTFHWAASLQPTKHLAVSVGDAVRDKQAARRRNYIDRNKANKIASAGVDSLNTISYTPVGTMITEHPSISDISAFSDSELWNELKNRGYEIEDGRLVVITRKYLD